MRILPIIRLVARRRAAVLALAAALAAGAAPARAVQVATGTGAGMAGQAVDVALTVSNTTGLAIRSLQFELSYEAGHVTATDVLEAGTLVGAAGWGEATFHVTTSGNSGRLRVSQAGTTPLSGAGALVRLRFMVQPSQLGAISTNLTLASFTFNEGAPNDTTANGSIAITATPVISVSPNTGEIVRGQTLSFTAAGTVTAPVAWTTTDPAVATISPAGLLTGIAPGAVRVVAVDAAARRDTSNGEVLVRGMALTAGTTNAYVNQTIAVPITVGDLTGLGVRGGQVTLAFNATALAATAVVTAGTLLDGYGTVGFGARPGACTVDFAGTSDLAGAGTLCFVVFQCGSSAGTAPLTVARALFNETLPALTANGSVQVNALPVITVTPDDVTLLAGQTRAFALTGTVAAPVAWSVTDTAVATIDGTGLLTALRGGTARVRAEDAVGATDLNTRVEVYDFRVTAGTVAVVPGGTVSLPIAADRQVGALGIRSVQYELQWTSPHVAAVAPTAFGAISAWAPYWIASTPAPRTWRLVAAGSQALASGDSVLHRVAFTISPDAPVGIDIPITITTFLCNEGTPRALITSGVIQVRSTTGVPGEAAGSALRFDAPWPNPGRGSAFHFAIPAAGAGRVRLQLVGVDGRHVRTLIDGDLAPGTHEAWWDGADDAGRSAPPGVYFARLECAGRSLVRKVVRVR